MSSYLNAIKWSESVNVFYYNTMDRLRALSIRKLRSIAQFINQHVERYFVKAVLGFPVSKFNKEDLTKIIFNYMNKKVNNIIIDDYNVIIRECDNFYKFTYDSPDENTIQNIKGHIINKYPYISTKDLSTSTTDCHTLNLRYNNLETLIDIANDIIRGRKKSKIIDDLGVYLSKRGQFYIEFKGKDAKSKSEKLRDYILFKKLTTKPVYLIERNGNFYVLGMLIDKNVCDTIVDKRRKQLRKFSE